jgi:hypothetical protein
MNRDEAHAEVDRYFNGGTKDGAIAVFVVEIDDMDLMLRRFGPDVVDKWKREGKLQKVVDMVCDRMREVFHKEQFDECLELATTDVDFDKEER